MITAELTTPTTGIMKRYMNIAAISILSLMSCACNEEVLDPDADGWKDVPSEEELTDCIYFKDGSFTTATVDFTVHETQFSFPVLRKSEDGLECKADIELLTESELASQGRHYIQIPAEYYEITTSVEFRQNDEAAVEISFKTEKASEVAEFITSGRNSDKSPCIAIKLDVEGNEGIKADSKAGFLIISWSYENASFCRLSAKEEGADIPLYIDLVPFSDIKTVSVNHLSSYRINVSHSSGEIIGAVKVKAVFDEAMAKEYAETYRYDPLPADAVSLSENIEITKDVTSGSFSIDIDKSRLTGNGLYMAAVTLTSDNAEIDNTQFFFLVESPISYDGNWIDYGGSIEPEDSEGWIDYQNTYLFSPATQGGDGYLGGLFDRQAWHWHSTYGDPYYVNETFGHFVQIKLTEPASHGLRFNYWIRKMDPWGNPDGYAPSKLDIWYSTAVDIDNANSDTDGNWQKLTTLTRESDGLPYQEWGEMYSSPAMSLEGLGEITYLRFCFMERTVDGQVNYLGRDDGNNACVAIAEMRIWGN